MRQWLWPVSSCSSPPGISGIPRLGRRGTERPRPDARQNRHQPGTRILAKRTSSPRIPSSEPPTPEHLSDRISPDLMHAVSFPHDGRRKTADAQPPGRAAAIPTQGGCKNTPLINDPLIAWCCLCLAGESYSHIFDEKSNFSNNREVIEIAPGSSLFKSQLMLMVSTKPPGRRIPSARADETCGNHGWVARVEGPLNAREEEAAAARSEVRCARAKAMAGCDHDAGAPSTADLTL